MILKRICTALWALAFAAVSASAGIDPELFSNPPADAHTATWWHWMDGNITREGITRDLEAMKAQGITNATVLNIYRMIGVEGVPAVKFAGEEWMDMFRHAVAEGDRLGIEIGAANCDGWSESGGPWITPENSMKMYTWRKTFVRGDGRARRIPLAKPNGKERLYRDVAVVAYRSDAPNSFVNASPKLSCKGGYPLETLIKSHKYHDETRHVDLLDEFPAELLADGNPATGLTISDDHRVNIDFDKPFTASQLHIYVLVSAAKFPIPVVIETSEDGVNYSEAGRVFVKSANQLQKLDFPKATSRHWRLDINYAESPTTLGELCLLQKGERGVYDTVPETASEVIDLTGKMSEDGVLDWAAPRGNWTVIRFGYTSNGKFNHPASPEGVGLECDKMDTTALNIHFAAYPEKLIKAAGDYAGKAFTYLLVDSWECGQQDWTAAMPEEFLRRRGYSLTQYIPVLCGVQVRGRAESEAFRYDFDKTCGELVLDYYFKHLADLCHRNGLKLYSEGIYGGRNMPPVDVLQSYKYCDVPMTEFWAQASEYREWPIVYKPSGFVNHGIPYHVSLLYDKPVVGSEAFTGMALYSDSPIDLKLYGDAAYCAGVNRMILHSYVHQPTDRRPGVTLGIYGQTFNRNNTWFNYSDGFFDFEARVQYMLQKGARRADALVYIGDELPNVEMSAAEVDRLLPRGTKYQLVNQEVLLDRVSVKDGLLWLDGKWSFKFLALRGTGMCIETARKIEELVSGGAVVYGPRPVRSLSLNGLAANNEELESIASRLWDSGRVITGMRALKNAYTPELMVRGVDIDDILYLHKTEGDVDYYYISNKDNVSYANFECVFDLEDREPEIWDPMDGTVRKQMMYCTEDRTTVVPLSLRPRQSVFVVLRKADITQHVFRLTDEHGDYIFPRSTGDWSVRYPDVYLDGNGNICLRQAESGTWFAGFSDDVSCRVDVPAAGKVVLDGLEGTMSFDDEPMLGTMPIGGWHDFTGYLNPLIKYYSGQVTYTLKAVLPESFFAPGARVLMEIPQFGSTARLTINGETLPTVWDPSVSTDISACARPGENEITIVVTNPWRNRLVGDKAGVPSTEKHWTTSPLQQKHIPPQQIIHKYTLLYPAGISKNITIYSEKANIL